MKKKKNPAQTQRDKPPWDALLTHEAITELKQVGHLLKEARIRRGMTVGELATRVGVDRRTISQIEKGNSKVSIGIFFQTLSMLNLLRGIETILHPENDIEAMGNTLRRIRSRRPITKKIPDEKVNF